ncbi:poly(R)-hydroxyalkanoic acid synthase subunit PhaE [Ruegeria hyattellae]|uniref:poly(R)-hydroxyalkanoic acid synthase subunit PhaE n=1 Tax=Ruegeria hyattellae TaxID=3233337 RepID=UPI00355C857D
MSDDPLMKAWQDSHDEFLRAQEQFWRRMMAESPRSFSEEETRSNADDAWEAARAQGQAWFEELATGKVFANLADEGIARDTLQRALDPAQFVNAGSGEINRAIQKLVEGPEFADIGILERQELKATAEWLALRDASNELRRVTSKAWTRAFVRFSEEQVQNPEIWRDGLRAVIDRWLEIANDELIAHHRTSEFLNAQRNLLRAGMDYRLRERDLVEIWCETHSIPTRTEIDDLHWMVYELRRDVRALRKRNAEMEQKLRAPKKKRAAPSK